MQPYNIVIVDDEILSITAIEQIIKRSNLQINKIMGFESSSEALNYLKKHSCDILITDINMPDISGLELIKSIKSLNEITEIIVITDFGCLAYATQAMEYGIRYFLEKPFSPQKIIESVQKAIISLTKKHDQINLEEKNLVEQIVLEKAVTPINIPQFSYIMYYESSHVYLRAQLKDFFGTLGLHYVIGSYRDAIVLYFFNCNELTLDSFAPNNKIDIKNTVISVAVEQSTSTIRDSFEKSYQSLAMEFYCDHTNILPVSEFIDSLNNLADNRTNYIDSYFKRAIEKRQFNLAKELLSGLKNYSLESFLAPNNLKYIILTLLKQSMRSFDKDYETIKKFEESILKANNSNSFEIIVKKALDDLSIASHDLPSDNSISKNINLIIENNYFDSELSLKRISNNMLFLNPDYVGKVYQKETGIKFTSKLLEVRMSNAYRLLKEGKKVYEVASLVGFGNNSDYFSRLFKKQFNVSPSSLLE